MSRRIAGSLIVCALVSGCSIRARFSIEPADASALDSASDVGADGTPLPDASADGAGADASAADVVGDVTGDVQCGAGETACGGRCVDTQSDPSNCGACGTMCRASAGALSFACVTGRCVGECTTGTFVPNGVSGTCESVARLVAPISGSFVQGNTIELRFTSTGAVVHSLQLCADPGCFTAVQRTVTLDPSATSYVATFSAGELAAYNSGFVYWRLTAAGYESPVWSFRVLAEPATPPPIAIVERRRRLSLGASTDYSGDGDADIVMSAVQAGRRKLVLVKPPRSPATTPTFRGPYDVPAPHSIGSVIARVGDVNGDGRSDIAVSATSHTGVFVFRGGPDDFDPRPIILTPPAESVNFGSNIVGGDFDGDGYSDVVVADNLAPSSSQSGRVHVYWGSSTGPASARSTLIVPTGGPASGGRFGTGLESACDLDGDGTHELLVGAPHPMGSAPAVYLFRGGSRTIGAPAVLPPIGESVFGTHIGCLGDIDNDGDHDWATHTINMMNQHVIALYEGVGSGTSLTGMRRSASVMIGTAQVRQFLPAYDMLRLPPAQGLMDLVFVSDGMSSIAVHTHLNNNARSFDSVLGPIDLSSVLSGATRINTTVLHSASGEPQLFFIAPGEMNSRFGVVGTISNGDFSQPTVASVMNLPGVPSGLTNVGEVLMR
jgi:hypothetical protein